MWVTHRHRTRECNRCFLSAFKIGKESHAAG
jgi:hypothetical protein